MTTSGIVEVDPWDGLVGQDTAVSRLEVAATAPVHAYLLLGPPGVGTARAARGFAALVLSTPDPTPDGGAEVDPAATARHRRLAVAGTHPDLVEIQMEGSTLRVEDAEEMIRQASTSPVEGAHKVIVVPGVETLQEAAVGKVLKIVEEPPPSAIFVLLAAEVPPEMVTIASRCVTIPFAPVPTSLIETTLFAEGADPRRAKAAAAAAAGDIERARLLVADDELLARLDLWRSIPDRLDDRGATVVELVAQVREAIEGATVPLERRHEAEVAALDERVELTGERGSGRSVLVARQKREIRALRADELRLGLATLSRRYRDRLLAAPDDDAEASLVAIRSATEALRRNPNEALLLQHLFLHLAPTD